MRPMGGELEDWLTASAGGDAAAGEVVELDGVGVVDVDEEDEVEVEVAEDDDELEGVGVVEVDEVEVGTNPIVVRAVGDPTNWSVHHHIILPC